MCISATGGFLGRLEPCIRHHFDDIFMYATLCWWHFDVSDMILTAFFTFWQHLLCFCCIFSHFSDSICPSFAWCSFSDHFLSMKHTGQRFEGRVSQIVKLSPDFHFPWNIRDTVLKVEYPKKLNFRLIFTFRSLFSMKHTGLCFEGRVSQKVKLSLENVVPYQGRGPHPQRG